MRKSIKITIPEPCHEDWATMTQTEKGKHCSVCEKEVFDFTQKTDEQLYKAVTSGKNLCGRFNVKQLDREIALSRKQNNTIASYAASLLIPIAVLSTQEIKAQGSNPQTEQSASKPYKSLGIGSQTLETRGKIAITSSQASFIIKGNVSDEVGPLPGANIQIKGTTNGVQTDFDGNYTIEVKKDDVLIFSYIGFITKEVIVTSKKNENIKLDTDINTLEGIVMTGGISAEPFTSIKPKVNNYIPSAEETSKRKERKEHWKKVKSYLAFKREQKKLTRIERRKKKAEKKQ